MVCRLLLPGLFAAFIALGCMDYRGEDTKHGRGTPNADKPATTDPQKSSPDVARPQQSASPSDPSSRTGAAQGANPGAAGSGAISESSGGTNTQAVQQPSESGKTQSKKPPEPK